MLTDQTLRDGVAGDRSWICVPWKYFYHVSIFFRFIYILLAFFFNRILDSL